MDTYAYTVKDNRTDSTDYIQFFENMEKKGCQIVNRYGEKDSKGKLHYHGIVKIPTKIYRKALCLKGLHLKLKELTDEEGWTTYIKKDQGYQSDDTDDNDLMKKLTYSLF